VIPELIANGRYEYTWIGISGGDLSLDLIELLELDRDTRGVLVGRVSDNSPAEEAGLRGSDKRAEINGLTYQIGGDIITALDDTPVTGINDLIAFLAENTRPGDQITVTLIRGNEVLQVPVTLEARPDQAR
jgi:S1-C subfamily serine protease